MDKNTGMVCNFVNTSWRKIVNFLRMKTNNSKINYHDYLSKFEKLTFLVLIGYTVIATISVFVFDCVDSKEHVFQWPFLLISILSLITCGIYFLFKRKEGIIKFFYFVLILLMDAFSIFLVYCSMNIANELNSLHYKYVYFFIISTIIFAILKFNFSFIQILSYLGYKSIIFGILINAFIKKDSTNKIEFSFEIICFSISCFSIFLFTLIKQDFMIKSVEFYLNNKFAIEYFQSLINTINKGFLSINLTNYTINVNKSFINIMKTIGISEELIHENLYNPPEKKVESNLLNLRSFRRSGFSIRNDFKNLSSSERFYLKNSNLMKGKNSTITKNLNQKVEKDLSDYIGKDNSELKNFNYPNNKDDYIKDMNEIKNRNEKNNKDYKLDFNIIPVCNNQESFLFKIDFLLNHVFCHFYEENSNKGNNRSNKNFNYDKSSLSEAIREIFYSKEKKENPDHNFIFKGIYESKENKILKNSTRLNIILEVYYRKIKTMNGELVEFFFNDLTQRRDVEMEKAENKVKALVLSKVSNEFKTPLITIIYILKNYIKKTHLSKNGLSFEEVETFDEDYISNTIDLSDYMLSLVNDIVDYSVINSDYEFKCEFDSFDLHELLSFSHRILKILINCRGLKDYVHPLLEINENVPRTFCSDEKRVKQILLNLITNSIKFTRRGYIKISAIMSNEKKLIVSIEDTGIGIQSKDISRIFKEKDSQRWEKPNADQEAVSKIGSGLGLSICKRIIEKIGKCIEVESIPNKKTRFYFILESKQVMKKSMSITRTLEGNLEKFKKTIMNVTTKSVKQAIIDNTNPRRPKSFNSHMQVNRFINNNNINNNAHKSYFQNKNFTLENNDNAINLNRFKDKPLEKKASKISKSNNSKKDNIGEASDFNVKANAAKFDFEMSKSDISSCDDTIKLSETKQRIEFPYNMMTERSNSSNSSIKLKNPFLLQKPLRSNMKSSSKLKNEIDKSFFKFIKPIKKFYDLKNRDIILVVDDNKFLRKSLKNNIRSIFINTCVDVIGCSDGIEILYLVMLDQMTKNCIRLIISDENMVYMNGTELNMILSSFHMEGKMAFIPFALCSAARNDDEFMMRNRINYIINKPPTKNELKSVFMTLNLI